MYVPRVRECVRACVRACVRMFVICSSINVFTIPFIPRYSHDDARHFRTPRNVKERADTDREMSLSLSLSLSLSRKFRFVSLPISSRSTF